MFEARQKNITKTEKTNTIQNLHKALQQSEIVIIGAGAGLSTSAGFIYNGERFYKYFSDFEEKYHFKDMYSGGFYPYETPEEHWAYWSRYIYINRYMSAPNQVYEKLLSLVKDKEYFVLTTNVDHCFQKAGFDKKRLFYTQGDYGLWQCSEPCHNETYDNKETVLKMLKNQGFEIKDDLSLKIPKGKELKMTVASEFIPKCPKCGKPMSMNLRSDNTFVEDYNWHIAAQRYSEFLEKSQNKKVLFLELGVGYNTPSIIKFSFWEMVSQWKNAIYACINYGEAYAPTEIKSKSICINGDIAEVIR